MLFDHKLLYQYHTDLKIVYNDASVVIYSCRSFIRLDTWVDVIYILYSIGKCMKNESVTRQKLLASMWLYLAQIKEFFGCEASR